MNKVIGGQSSGRLDVRVRGNAHQLLEKYKQMAHDSQQAGDRVASEFYLQHADHYFRIVSESRHHQEEARARRNGSDSSADSFEPESRRSGRVSEDSVDNGKAARTARDTRSRRRPTRRPESSGENQRERGREEDAPQDADESPEVLELYVSDGEAALVAFSDRAGAADEAGEDESAAIDDEEAPRPRRRGRPRKTAASES